MGRVRNWSILDNGQFKKIDLLKPTWRSLYHIANLLIPPTDPKIYIKGINKISLPPE